MTRSPETIEREIEQTRREVDRTADALKDKLSPGQLMDELMQSMKTGGGSEMMGNFGRQVKDNPMPLALIGAGIAWLMAGSGGKHDGSGSSSDSVGYDGVTGQPPYGTAARSSESGDHHGLVDKAKEAAHGVGDRASSALGTAKVKVSSGVGHAADAARSTGHQASSAAAYARRKGQDTFYGAVQSEPLIVGALGLALGAALGAVLPSTEFEDEHVGPLRDRVLDQGKERLNDAKEIAKSAVRTAKDEVQHQGFEADAQSLVQKAEQVVRTTAEAARNEASNRTGR